MFELPFLMLINKTIDLVEIPEVLNGNEKAKLESWFDEIFE